LKVVLRHALCGVAELDLAILLGEYLAQFEAQIRIRAFTGMTRAWTC